MSKKLKMFKEMFKEKRLIAIIIVSVFIIGIILTVYAATESTRK